MLSIAEFYGLRGALIMELIMQGPRACYSMSFCVLDPTLPDGAAYVKNGSCRL